MSERYIQFSSHHNQLSAIIHDGSAPTGVLILVGGPQYRVGSHRQFVKLSRFLSINNIPSMRVDTSGMGDSDGEKAAFYQQTEDINQAVSAFFDNLPHLKKVVLWGLCDAASAILIKLQQPDTRICGVVLLNPWVRQQQSHADAMLKHYYLKRLLKRQFWQKMLRGGVALRSSLKEIWQTLKLRHAKRSETEVSMVANEQNYVQLMLEGWQNFNGKSLLVTSGNDLTAKEFLDLCKNTPAWQHLLAESQHTHIASADHTFSNSIWRKQTEQLTLQFVLQRMKS